MNHRMMTNERAGCKRAGSRLSDMASAVSWSGAMIVLTCSAASISASTTYQGPGSRAGDTCSGPTASCLSTWHPAASATTAAAWPPSTSSLASSSAGRLLSRPACQRSPAAPAAPAAPGTPCAPSPCPMPSRAMASSSQARGLAGAFCSCRLVSAVWPCRALATPAQGLRTAVAASCCRRGREAARLPGCA